MARFFTGRDIAATLPTTALFPSLSVRTGTVSGVRCASHQPGHEMHYTQQGQALRSPAERAVRVTVDGHRVLVVLDSGTQLAWRHHDPARLTAILDRFGAARTAYPRFRSLRVGPYWFNCADADRFEPCGEATRP